MSGVSNLGEFLTGMDEEIAATEAQLLAETRRAATIVIETVVPATPVRTGLHRGSWSVGLGADPVAAGALDPSGAETIAAALAAIEEARAGQRIIVLNDGPAIEELDDGRSDQAPHGFSERAVSAATRP